MNKSLLILGCSQRKKDLSFRAGSTENTKQLPAFELYDGPMYRVLRKFLREHQWPEKLSVGVLSAKHKLFGAIKEIDSYDKKMSRHMATEMAKDCDKVLSVWSAEHSSIYVSVGKDYLPALSPRLSNEDENVQFIDGGIGVRQRKLKDFLSRQSPSQRRKADTVRKSGPPKYILPDWDDLLDPEFDFDLDTYSGPDRKSRNDQHLNQLMRPTSMCDGILVSLAQRQTVKGPLRKLKGTEQTSLNPLSLRRHFGLTEKQYLFGDCGAFSYVDEERPTVSTEQAIALYELYNFDFGTSVDHIPIKPLSGAIRQYRVELTRQNAQQFIETWHKRGKLFTPVGAVQGVSAEHYGENVQKYFEMGYRHMAIGGLVPLKDQAIAEVVKSVFEAVNKLPQRPWIHLFGIYRPKLQEMFRSLGVDSFDSATFFRKAWLRSDQNYLGTNGRWYTALRVPMVNDPRTRKRLLRTGCDVEQLERKERYALKTLVEYGKGEAGIEETLSAVLDYDSRLLRSSDIKTMRNTYRRTLEDKPWQECDCVFCQKLGIHILIFRGGNRNRRRGAHNTLMLYGYLRKHHD